MGRVGFNFKQKFNFSMESDDWDEYPETEDNDEKDKLDKIVDSAKEASLATMDALVKGVSATWEVAGQVDSVLDDIFGMLSIQNKIIESKKLNKPMGRLSLELLNIKMKDISNRVDSKVIDISKSISTENLSTNRRSHHTTQFALESLEANVEGTLEKITSMLLKVHEDVKELFGVSVENKKNLKEQLEELKAKVNIFEGKPNEDYEIPDVLSEALPSSDVVSFESFKKQYNIQMEATQSLKDFGKFLSKTIGNVTQMVGNDNSEKIIEAMNKEAMSQSKKEFASNERPLSKGFYIGLDFDQKEGYLSIYKKDSKIKSKNTMEGLSKEQMLELIDLAEEVLETSELDSQFFNEIQGKSKQALSSIDDLERSESDNRVIALAQAYVSLMSNVSLLSINVIESNSHFALGVLITCEETIVK